MGQMAVDGWVSFPSGWFYSLRSKVTFPARGSVGVRLPVNTTDEYRNE